LRKCAKNEAGTSKKLGREVLVAKGKKGIERESARGCVTEKGISENREKDRGK
jgi:hypothetical protein